jgi:hypothetical protein
LPGWRESGATACQTPIEMPLELHIRCVARMVLPSCGGIMRLIIVAVIVALVGLPAAASAQGVLVKPVGKWLFGAGSKAASKAVPKTAAPATKAPAVAAEAEPTLAEKAAARAIVHPVECNTLANDKKYNSLKCTPNRKVREIYGVPRQPEKNATKR